MTPSGHTVCLCMIVRNETPVIRRSLASVRPVIDHWLIVDTGSSDGTQDLIRAFMGDMPGELVERPWVDFGHNRSEALALARHRADYSLIIDADDEFLLPPGFAMPELGADSYVVDITDGGIAYRRTQLVRNALPWRYAGVLHEFLTCEGATSAGNLSLVMRRNHDGKRRREPSTYANDAAILERALATETDPFLISRYTFYLAQSFRDCGNREAAVEAYLRRAGLGYWDQEVFVALNEAARQMEALGRDPDAIIATYQRATEACATRAEAAHGASRFCRWKNRFAQGYAIAEAALGRAAPADGLFVETWVYRYGLLDEYAVNAYWSGHYRECRDACATLLARDDLSSGDRERIAANRRFALDRLAETPPSGVGWRPGRPLGGTELMVEGLRGRMGPALEAVNLCVNLYDERSLDARPLILWVHHDVDQHAVQWLRDRSRAERVHRFVFVSEWQRQRYLAEFGLRAERCVVLRNATEVPAANRTRTARQTLKLAYSSAPYRGLSVLLDAWDALRPANAELHVWSSHKLYGPNADDGPYQPLYTRAASLPNVAYHGIVPNAELRDALREFDILAYPSTFQETSCLAAIDAMAAGCRVVCPAHGALPETVGRFGRIYPFTADPSEHARLFAGILAEEIRDPWEGRPALADEQQDDIRRLYDWPVRVAEWQRLVDALVAEARPSIAARPVAPAAAPKIFRPRIKKIAADKGTFYVTEKDFIGEFLSSHGEWEPHLLDFATMVLRTDSNIIDLGANFGYHTVCLAKLAPRGEVFSFEPMNLCFSQLQMNLVANAIGNVRAYKLAATDRSGDAVELEPLEATMNEHGMVNLGHTGIGSGGDFAFTVRLDDLPLPKIDFIKMDVQGSESQVLEGMRTLMARDRPAVFVEIEEKHLRRSDSSSKALIEAFLALDYSLVRVCTDWPTDHLALPNERGDLIEQCMAQKRHRVELLKGSTIELTFENDYFYARFTTS